MNSVAHRLLVLVLLLSIVMAGLMEYGSAQPGGASIVSNVTETVPAAPAGSLATAGGSFTTLVLNATTQTPRWKAYVGNITGELALQDASSQKMYDWQLSVITGEVYASRNNSITWSNIECANRSTLALEDSFLNISTNKADSINKTFNNTVHRGFFVGNTWITNSTCPAIATYVNSSKQSVSQDADFQEILLQDNSALVYSTLLEQDSQGYNINRTFDFQLILAENEFQETPTTYYFYAELG